jgi:hypothetical protein
MPVLFLKVCLKTFDSHQPSCILAYTAHSQILDCGFDEMIVQHRQWLLVLFAIQTTFQSVRTESTHATSEVGQSSRWYWA